MSSALATRPALPQWATRSPTGRVKLFLLRVFKCQDCEVDVNLIGEWYWVQPAVWAQAGPCARGYLCIGCLETRIGRTLTSQDFTDDDANRSTEKPWTRRSARFTERLAARPTTSVDRMVGGRG